MTDNIKAAIIAEGWVINENGDGTEGESEAPKQATVTVADATKVYGDNDPDFTWTITATQDGNTVELDVAEFEIKVSHEGSDVGTYPLTASGESTQNEYELIFMPGTLTITRAPATVTANSFTMVQGEEEELTATVTGLKNGDPESVINYTLSRENPESKHSGNYVITPSGAAEQGNYTVRYVNGLLTIQQLTITFKNGNEVLSHSRIIRL